MLAVLLLAVLTDTVRVRGGDAAALQAAVAGATPQRVILVGAGRYEGGLILDRPVTLVGEGRPELWGGRMGTVVRITAPGVTLRGFRIRGSGSSLDRDDAGVNVQADSATLEDLDLTDVLHGIYLRAVWHVAIHRVTIRGRADVRPNDRGDGIHFFRSAHIVAMDNDIADVRDGLYFSYSDTTVVRGTRVTRSRYGLHYMFSHANTFEDNSFTHSSAGSSIMNSRDVIARRNLFAFNRGAGSFGLLQQTTERTLLEGNRFVANGTGLFLDGVSDGVIRGNLIADNFTGLQLFPSTVRTILTGNAIVGNTYAAAGGADLRFCAGGRGNYWTGDNGWDLDGDGVHDVVWTAGSPLTELSRERPALRLFLGSPAATVLDWAERTFPVFQIAAVTDPCPLTAVPTTIPAIGADAPPAPGSTRAAAACILGAGLLCFGLAWPRSRA